MTPDGLRIQIIDKQNRPMFATGSAQVQSYMRDILRELGPTFNRLPNPLSISGPTDSVQYASGERDYSTWAISADRANEARRELVARSEERSVGKECVSKCRSGGWPCHHNINTHIHAEYYTTLVTI